MGRESTGKKRRRSDQAVSPKAKRSKKTKESVRYATLEHLLIKNPASTTTSINEEEEQKENKDGNDSTAPQVVVVEEEKKVHPFFLQGRKKQPVKKKAPPVKDDRLEPTVKKDEISPDTMLAAVPEIFLNSEQKKRKRELKNMAHFQQELKKSKELNPLFCKPYTGDKSKHPLLAPKPKNLRKSVASVTTNFEIADFDCAPLDNVSDSKSWIHGPPEHVNYRRASQCDLKVVNAAKPVLDLSVLDKIDEENDSEDYENIYEDWWFKIFAERTRIRQESQETVKEPESPIVFDLDISQLAKKYMTSMHPKLEEVSKKYSSGMDYDRMKTIFERLLSRRLPTKTSSFDLSLKSGGLWTDKYRPLSKDEIIDESDSVNELWSWMKNWEKFRESVKQQERRNKQRAISKKTAAHLLYVDEEEWMNESDGSDSEDEFDPVDNNLIMISGGLSSGKSAAVYACANELGFHVFEVNSSSERSQAAVQRLTEATQSHQIQRFFSNKTEDSNSESQTDKIQASSLLLFEEVDNLFNTDKGFFTGVKKIQKTTKRPLILTSNETLEIEDLTMCKQLQFHSLDLGIQATQSQISDSILKRAEFLYMVLLCEGLDLDMSQVLLKMVTHAKCDIRNLLLTLQFWSEDSNRLPYMMGELLQKPVDMTVKCKDLVEKSLSIYHIATHLNNLSKLANKSDISIWQDELSHARCRQYDIMFNNYLSVLDEEEMLSSDSDILTRVSEYIDNLSLFDLRPREDDEMSNSIYSDVELLNHLYFVTRFVSAAAKPAVNNKQLDDPLAMTINLPSIKIYNPLATTQYIECKKGLVSLIRKVVSPLTSLHLMKPDVIHTVLYLCTVEDSKRSRRTSRRFYHRFQDCFNEDERAKLTQQAFTVKSVLGACTTE